MNHEMQTMIYVDPTDKHFFRSITPLSLSESKVQNVLVLFSFLNNDLGNDSSPVSTVLEVY